MVVGHVDIAGFVDGHAGGDTEAGGAARPIGGAGVARRTGQGRDHAAGGDLADQAVGVVGHIDIARGIHCDAARQVELRAAPGAVRRARCARGARQRGDYTGRGDLAHRAVEVIRDIDVTGIVRRHTEGVMEQRRAAGAVAGAIRPGGTSQRGNRPGGADLPDGVVALVGHGDRT